MAEFSPVVPASTEVELHMTHYRMLAPHRPLLADQPLEAQQMPPTPHPLHSALQAVPVKGTRSPRQAAVLLCCYHCQSAPGRSG